MGRVRGPKEGTVRLQLSDGDWLEVLEGLSAGQERDISVAFIKEVTKQGSWVPDDQELGYAAAAIYICAWSLHSAVGPIFWPNPKPKERVRAGTDTYKKRVSILSGDDIDPDTMREIEAAIEKHRESMKAEVDEGKKLNGGNAGEVISGTTSPSVDS